MNYSGRLMPGERLAAGQNLWSKNKRGLLLFQTNGNLSWWAASPDANGNAIQNPPPWNMWQAWITDKGGTSLVMQTDGNLVVQDKAGRPVWSTGTPDHPGGFLIAGDDGELALADAQGLYWALGTHGFNKPSGTPWYRGKTSTASQVVSAVEKVPVLGDAVHIVGEAAAAPYNLASAIASGERLDHALVGALKDQLAIVKDIAPYAQTIVSLVPGLGTGVGMALGAGIAIAEGQSITDAAKAAIRGALPGGPLVTAGFDAALKVAGGENIGQVALETARSQLPPEAQKAFDIGLAVATGEKIQTALARGLASFAPGQLQTILAAGQAALGTTRGLSDALALMPAGGPTEGFKLAAGLLSHAGINEKALTAARSQLPPDVVQGFDAALKTQIPHTAWLANVTSAPVAGRPGPQMLEPPKRTSLANLTPEQQKQLVDYAKATADTKALAKLTPEQQKQLVDYAKGATAPKMLEPPKRAVATTVAAYGPYPKIGALSGAVGACFDMDAVTWGPAVTGMSNDMERAGRSAVHGSRGRPRAVRGPDGTDYLFSIENGVLSARPAVT